MTSLKPIENRRVRAVASETYPSNLVCAHPDCTEKVQLRPDGTPTVHHIFPRSQIKSKSYFVAVEQEDEHNLVDVIYPHAVGLCGSGTTGHHGDVEEHRAWIKLEDGEYVWYDRYHSTRALEPSGRDGEFEINTCGLQVEKGTGVEGCPPERPCNEWRPLGPLNPQPGSREGKAKRRKFAGEAKRKRANWQVRVPADAEDGAGILDDGLETAYKFVCLDSDIEYDSDTTSYVKLTYVLHWVSLHA